MVMVEHSSSPKEGRLRRWSRLKTDGDADTGDQPPPDVPATEEGYAAPDPHAMPGGAAIRRGATVPAMASLVIDEVADDVVGAEEDVADVSAVDTAPAEDPPLTPEEEAIVKDLPPFESLTKDSDYTPFLADKVPEFIRRRALSILWRSDPVLANLDGLNDYDENFRVIDTLISAAKDTIYRVGKGYEKDDEEPIVEEADTDGKASEGTDDGASEMAGDVTEKSVGQPVEQSADANDSDAADEAAPEKQSERLSASSVRKPGDAG